MADASESPTELDALVPFPSMRRSASGSRPSARGGRTSRNGMGSVACSRTPAVSCGCGRGTAVRCCATSRSCGALGELLPPRSALDGEIVIDIDGAIDFDAMQTRLHPAESRINRLSGEIPARFVGFDVLVWEGTPVWRAPVRRAPRRPRARRGRLRPSRRPSPTRTRPPPGSTISSSSVSTASSRNASSHPLTPVAGLGREGEARPDGRLCRRRRALEVEADRKIATLLLGLYDSDGEIDYVGSAAVAAASTTRSQRKASLLLDETSDRHFGEPNRWGGSGLEQQPLRPELVAEVRYDKVQGPPVPARDEAVAVPAGQGSGRSAPGPSCNRRESRAG